MREGSTLISLSLRLGLTLTIVLIVISSPFLVLNPVLISAKSNNVDTSSQHSAFSLEDTPSAPLTSSAPPTKVSPMDSDFTTQAPLQIPRTLQSNDLVNSLAFYEVTFITSTTGAIDKIRMDFPAGTGVGAAGIIERIGIGGGTLLKSGSSITYDVTSPVSIPAGTFIRLEMFGIKNPINPSTTFTADITTRDSGGNLIDGPSQTNVYTIKKIVSSDLADGAVTTPKIADGAITPEAIERVGATSPAFALVATGAFAECLPGEEAVGGGFELLGIVQELKVISEKKLEFGTTEAWEVVVFNSDSNDHSFQVRVICMPAMP
jgi:hypothetical protein